MSRNLIYALSKFEKKTPRLLGLMASFYFVKVQTALPIVTIQGASQQISVLMEHLHRVTRQPCV